MSKDSFQSPWAALALVGQLGLTVAIPLALGGFFGAFLDNRLHTQPWITLVGILLGLVVGIFGAYRLVIGLEKASAPPRKTG